MSISVTPINNVFGATITNLDLGNGGSDADIAVLLEAFETYSLLVLPKQAMNDDQQVAFSAKFGPLEHTVRSNPAGNSYFARQSNIDINTGEIIPADDRRMLYQKGNYQWHADSTFKPVLSKCSILSAREIPKQGGATEFASTRAAYDSLNRQRQLSLEGLIVEHDLNASRQRLGFDFNAAEKTPMTCAQHPLVYSNAINARKSLLIGSHASGILGMPESESRGLLNELLELSTRAEHCIRHEWREDDIVIWANCALLHRATSYDGSRYRRLMQRTTVSAGSAAELHAMESEQQ